jgi:putative aldouronate transport system substrate-binding protein
MFIRKGYKIGVLLVILALLLATACQGTSQEQPNTETTTTQAVTTTAAKTTTAAAATTTTTAATTTQKVEENPFAEFYEISWLTHINDDKYIEGAMDELMIEERYNVDFKVWNISNYDAEGIAMMLAAGDIPDVSYLPHSPLNQVQLYEEGFTRSIHIDMYKKYFPYYYQQMENNAPSSYNYSNIKKEDGSLSDEYYGVAMILGRYKTYYNWPLIRLDWLESVGYDPPESELVPVKISDEKLGKYDGQLFITNHVFAHEEMNDIFRAFTEDDPDGNGIDDTYGAVIYPHNHVSWVDSYWGQFGITTAANYLYLDETTGDVVPYYAHTGFRDYMEWAFDMYQKGYMRTLPEGFQSLAPQGSWYDNTLANWATGKIGFFLCDSQYIARPDLPEYSDRQPPQSIWMSVDESATFLILPAMAGPGPEGTWGSKRHRLDAFATSAYTIGASVSDDKLARIFTIWNDAYSNPDDDFWRTIVYGIEGVHYRWTGEPWAGGQVQTPIDKIPSHYRRYASEGNPGFIGSFTPEYGYNMNEVRVFIWGFSDQHSWTKKYTVEPYKYIDYMYMGSMYNDYVKDWQEVSGEIMAVMKDFINRHWVGQIANIYTEWESYITRLYAAGLGKIVDDYFNNDKFEKYTRPVLP